MTRTLYTLIRREYWEHRSLWIAPLAVAALMLAVSAVGRINYQWTAAPSADFQRSLFGLVLISFAIPVSLTMAVVLWFYASDCLYAERRDRSILFWKSMPVSDALTVFSKVLVVLLVAPLSVFLLNLVTSLIASGIWSARGWGSSPAATGWDTQVWLRVQGIGLVAMIVSSLWYAPVMAYVMLISAWARRAVSVWVFVPPLALALIERVALGTHYVWDVIVYRLVGLWRQANLRLDMSEQMFAQGSGPGGAGREWLRHIDPAVALGNVDLWLGVAVAAVLIYAMIRIRRYSDET